MSLRHLLPLLLVLLAPTLRAQQSEALADLADAEAAVADKRAEDAALLLRSAARRVLLAEDPAVRAELEPRIAALRAKTDPSAKAADDACLEAANAIVKVALRYEERGWLRTSRDLLVRAVEIAPMAAQDALRRVRERLTGQRVETTGSAASWFQDGETLDGPDGWIATADTLTVIAPTAQQKVTRHVSSRRAKPERLRWSCEVQRQCVHGIGLMFAYRHAQDFHVAMLRPSEGKWFARIARASGGQYDYLAEGWLPEPAAPGANGSGAAVSKADTSLMMRLEVDDGRIRFAVGGLELKADAPASLRSGFLGLQVEHTGVEGPATMLTAIGIEAESKR